MRNRETPSACVYASFKVCLIQGNETCFFFSFFLMKRVDSQSLSFSNKQLCPPRKFTKLLWECQRGVFYVCGEQIHIKNFDMYRVSSKTHRRKMTGHILPSIACLASDSASNAFKNDFGLAGSDSYPSAILSMLEKWKMFCTETSPQACSCSPAWQEPFNLWIHQTNENHDNDERVRWTKPTGTLLFAAISQSSVSLAGFTRWPMPE